MGRNGFLLSYKNKPDLNGPLFLSKVRFRGSYPRVWLFDQKGSFENPTSDFFAKNKHDSFFVKSATFRRVSLDGGKERFRLYNGRAY